jgi:hypothetical protein
VLESHPRTLRRQRPASGLGPLDEDDGLVEVRLEVAPLGRGEPAEAVKVEMRHVRRAGVAVPDREGRAGDARRDAERTAGAADEGGLPGAELAGDQDDVAGDEACRKPTRKRLRLLRRAGHDLDVRHG